MKKALLLGLSAAALLTGIGKSYAQPVLGGPAINYNPPGIFISAPVSIVGLNPATTSFPNGWGADPAISAVINMQVARITPDSLGCTPPTNSLTGKAALIYRGTCNFSQKAYNAQLQGATAVIVVNNAPGDPVGMGAGTNANLVTIPVFMVSQAAGNAMNTQLIAGQTVTVTYVRWSQGFSRDLGITTNSTAKPHDGAVPLSQMIGNNNPAAYRNYTGAFVGNFGTATQSNIKLRMTTSFTPTGGTRSEIRRDSVTVASLAPIDSVKDADFVSPNFFNLTAPATTGRYDYVYSVGNDSVDQSPSNNRDSLNMFVTDSVFSKGRYNPVTGSPVYASSNKYGSTTIQEMTWGPLYYVARRRFKAVMAQFSVSKFNATASSDIDLNGTPDVFVTVYQWRDGANGNPVDSVAQGSELRPVAQGIKFFGVGDSSGENYTAMLNDYSDDTKPAILNDSGWYWVAVKISNQSQRLGVDQYNFYTRVYAASQATQRFREYWSPQVDATAEVIDTTSSADSLRMFAFSYQGFTHIDSIPYTAFGFNTPISETYCPAVALHISKRSVDDTVVTNSILAVGSAFQTFELFPNPASGGAVNVRYDLTKLADHVTLEVVNALGQTVRTMVIKNTLTNTVSIPTSDLVAGQYYMVIGANGKSIGRSFTIAGK